MVSVDTLMHLGGVAIQTGISSGQEGAWAPSYASKRIETLINDGYSAATAEQITYFELGLKISLDVANSKLIQAGATEIGGGIGAIAGELLAGPAGAVVGEWMGSGLGWFAGGQVSSWVDEFLAQKLSKYIFDNNLESQDVDLSKIPTYISNPDRNLKSEFSRGKQGVETTCAFNFIDNSGRTSVLLPLVSALGLTITPDIAALPDISGSNALLGLQYAMAA